MNSKLYTRETFNVKAIAIVCVPPKDEKAKSYKVTFKLTGEVPEGFPPKPEAYADKTIWNEADFPDDLEGDLSFERVPMDEGKSFMFSVQSWNGKSKAPYEKKEGKGGKGGGYTPRSAEEIHSSSVAGIIKSGMDAAAALGKIEGKGQLESIINIGLNAYWDSMDKAKSRAGQSSAPATTEETK